MANEILVTRGLTKRYGNHLAVDHVELSIQKGQIYGLVGRNGAGKTTIIRMVTAQTVPTEGEVSLFGASGERELSKMRARTGAMVETPSFYPYLTAGRTWSITASSGAFQAGGWWTRCWRRWIWRARGRRPSRTSPWA